MSDILNFVNNNIMWGPLMIVALFGTHLFFTFKTGFVQKYVFKGVVKSFSKEKGKGDISVFSSLMTALSSTIGTGNIIGVGTAIVAGGPGAVFWTWIGGFFGIATKYAETLIAVKYRKKLDDGSYMGGAMTAFEHLGKKKLAIAFALCCSFGAFGIGCLSQGKAIADILNENFHISTLVTAIVLVLMTFTIVFGGIKSIGKACEKLVPVMSLVYIVGCVIILCLNFSYLPATFAMIFKSAFTGKAIFGGMAGAGLMAAMRNGIARGLFSNEAGMGSSPQASAAGSANNAVKPALVGSTGVFWDTIVVCLLTGLVLVSSVIGLGVTDLSSGAALVSACFNRIPVLGKPLLVFGILTFAYSTILGWSYYGENTMKYLFGKKSINFYRILWLVMVFIGCVSSEGIVWTMGDIMNASMCIPNMIALWMLKDQIVEDTKKYLHSGNLDEEDNQMA